MDKTLLWEFRTYWKKRWYF